MDAARIKWTKVKLEYNKHKNQWRMIYSAKSIPLGEDEKGIKRYKQVRKIIPIPIPLGYHPTFDPKTKQEIKLPKSDEDIEAWATKYPDVAAIVETIAIKKAKEQSADLEDRVKAVDEMRETAAREKAEAELMQLHPDFDTIRDSDDFHEWADEQPKWIQDALYENGNDARSAARAIDLYKADRGIKKGKTTPKDAARSVNTRNQRSKPQSDSMGNAIKESEVQKMSPQEYERNADSIMESIRTGNFIYDLSGSAR